MGRHIWFRTPTKEDRKDIFDLYITRVAHEADLDTDEGRDELARITNGYSPAMIEQSCSMALTIAQAEGLWAHALSVGLRRRLAEGGSFDVNDVARVAWPETLRRDSPFVTLED